MVTDSLDSTSARNLQRQQYLHINAGVMGHEFQNITNGNNKAEKEITAEESMSQTDTQAT